MTADGENLTPGEMLAAARSKTELSLEQMAENTKIPLNMLRAIEMDEYHKISGDLYVKSFLRSYAKEVELDPEEMIELYHIFTGATGDNPQGAVDGAWNESDVQIKHLGLPWGLIISIGVVVVAAAFAFYWYSMKEPADVIPEESVVKPVEYEVMSDGVASSATVIDTIKVADSKPDTLALGWQVSKPAVNESLPTAMDKPELPEAFAGTPQNLFLDGQEWAYVVRLRSERPGQFEVMKDAETIFQKAEFPVSPAEAQPLPTENLVGGRAYAVKRGFVVYWGVNDHLSLRLGQITGVELSFNGQVQDLARFSAGQEILLDPSLLNEGAGN